jgi:hypothetical protein
MARLGRKRGCTSAGVRKKENAISTKPTDTQFHYCHLRLKLGLNSAPSDRGICRVKAKPPRSAVTVRIQQNRPPFARRIHFGVVSAKVVRLITFTRKFPPRREPALDYAASSPSFFKGDLKNSPHSRHFFRPHSDRSV